MQAPSNLDTKKAAAYLGLAEPTLKKYRVDGRGPAYTKIGNRVFYDTTDLDAFKQAHRVEPKGN